MSNSSAPAVGPIVGGILILIHSVHNNIIITITGVFGGISAIVIVVIAILVIVIVIRSNKKREGKNKSQFIMISRHN